MTSLDDALIEVGYKVDKCVVYDEKNPIGLSVPKHNLYNMFLVPSGIDYRNYNSKQWLPDECFINFDNNVAYIIEKNFRIVQVRLMRSYRDAISKNGIRKAILSIKNRC